MRVASVAVRHGHRTSRSRRCGATGFFYLTRPASVIRSQVAFTSARFVDTRRPSMFLGILVRDRQPQDKTRIPPKHFRHLPHKVAKVFNK